MQCSAAAVCEDRVSCSVGQSLDCGWLWAAAESPSPPPAAPPCPPLQLEECPCTHRMSTSSSPCVAMDEAHSCTNSDDKKSRRHWNGRPVQSATSIGKASTANRAIRLQRCQSVRSSRCHVVAAAAAMCRRMERMGAAAAVAE